MGGVSHLHSSSAIGLPLGGGFLGAKKPSIRQSFDWGFSSSLPVGGFARAEAEIAGRRSPPCQIPVVRSSPPGVGLPTPDHAQGFNPFIQWQVIREKKHSGEYCEKRRYVVMAGLGHLRKAKLDRDVLIHLLLVGLLRQHGKARSKC